MAQKNIVRPKLRRSIYIGLGGTGTDAIKIVKDYFLATTSHVPTMIKFLAVDTNQPELSRKGFESSEQLALVLSRPQAIFNNQQAQYKGWIPDKNLENIQGIGNTGAGQVRSNGAFVLAVKEAAGAGQSFSSKLAAVRDNLVNANAIQDDSDYDLLATTKIDVHLCFSICGGTGSGMFIEIAKIIKSVIPNSNLIGYALSNSFYDNVGVHWNVKSNAYASLVELDYCMHAHKREYQNSLYEKVLEKPFDALMYIDNKTYTRNETEEEYNYEREEVLSNIAYAMVLSAGNLGDDANSIIDNLKGAILSGGYDIDCKNGKKSAWVSSLGVSEIFCRKNSSQDLFSHNLAIQELTSFKDGSTVNAAMTAKLWIQEFKINEGGPDDPDDHDELIDRMIDPNLYQQISAANSIKVDDNGTVNDSLFMQNSPIKFSSLESHLATFTEGIIDDLNRHVLNILFPSQGKTTCGLSYLMTVLNTFSQSIAGYRERLEKEISERESDIEKTRDDELTSAQQLKEELRKSSFRRSQQTITVLKNSIRAGRLKIFKLECAIKRRQMAIKVYSALETKITADYISEIHRLKNVLDEVVNTLNKEVGKFEIPERIEKKSTSIDVSSEISSLPESQIGDMKINDWNDFYKKTKKPTIKDLADKNDWKEFVLEYVRDLYPKEAAQPIVKILKLFEERGTLGNRLRDVLNRARPLMDISTYGKEEEIRPTEFVIVSLPNAEGEDTKFIRDAFDSEYHGDNQIQYVSIKDSNRIIVYRQLGVIPPFYIKGIATGKNGIFDPYSCEQAYISLRANENNYSPFTKKSYEDAVNKGGHSLDTFLGAISESDSFEMWIAGFILKLITRDKDNNYRFVSDEGKLDMDDPELKSYIILGKSRTEAYNNFANLKDSIKKELAKQQSQLLSNPDVKAIYDNLFDGTNVALVNYRKNYSLVTDEEFGEERNQMEKELNYLKTKNR